MFETNDECFNSLSRGLRVSEAKSEVMVSGDEDWMKCRNPRQAWKQSVQDNISKALHI